MCVVIGFCLVVVGLLLSLLLPPPPSLTFFFFFFFFREWKVVIFLGLADWQLDAAFICILSVGGAGPRRWGWMERLPGVRVGTRLV